MEARDPKAVRAFREKSQESNYANDPCGYARDMLKVRWWAKQQEVAEALTRPPYKVLVKACHKIGKTMLGGGLVNWWYDSHNPGLVLTTAPTDLQVRDLLWKEVRVQRGQRGGFRGPKMPRLESSPDHWAHGFTARDGDAFQGRHSPHTLIIFDEAVGIDRVFWETAKSMFAGEGHAWLCIFNPTDTSSQAYIEEATGNWTVISVSALDHPNIASELAGSEPPFPSAVRLDWLDERLREWCQPLAAGDSPQPTDIRWPPLGYDDYATQRGHVPGYLRPGPIAESRLLGRWPSQGTYGVWSDALWQAIESLVVPADQVTGMVEIGCDVARFGDDWTAIHVRRGAVSLHHEAANGWSTAQTAGRLKQLARQYAAVCSEDPSVIPIKVDDDGVGGGVVDQAGDYNFIPINAGSSASRPADYPNRRSELWFQTASKAAAGLLSLARLPADVRQRLRQQAMAPTWKLDSAGRRVVEPKADTKKRLKRSPDDVDAMNLAWLSLDFKPSHYQEDHDRDLEPQDESAAGRRGLFGRKR